jgi:hypothetical protein
MVSHVDFPVTRRIIDRMNDWVDNFARDLAPAARVPVETSFRWEHAEKSPRSAQVAKAVRAVSGLRAAMQLADVKHTIESGVILRAVADYAAEIIYLGEAILEGRMTPDQAKFVEQHFAPLPDDPDDLAAREKEYYIGRKDIARAHRRVLEKFGGAADDVAKISAYLNKGYDSYVHGSNGSAMELYDVRSNSFMLRGHLSPRFVCIAKVAVAGKTQELSNALRFMAITWGSASLEEEIGHASDEMQASGEDSGRPCAAIR